MSPSDLAAIRSKPEPPDAWARVQRKCRAWVQHLKLGLPHEDIDDIVSDAITDQLLLLRDPKVPLEAVNRRLGTALGRHRRRMSLRRLQSLLSADFEKVTVSLEDRSAPHPASRLEASRLIQIVRGARRLLDLAFEHLPERDHDYLVEYYDLERIGKSYRGQERLANRKPATARKALERARIRFAKVVTRIALDAKLDSEGSGFDVVLLDDTVRFLRGELGADPVVVLMELRELIRRQVASRARR